MWYKVEDNLCLSVRHGALYEGVLGCIQIAKSLSAKKINNQDLFQRTCC
jgi:hypothetical protein